MCSRHLSTEFSHDFFFFQAEDGIRDVAVTGVQTCALPISPKSNILSRWAHSSRIRSIHPPSTCSASFRARITSNESRSEQCARLDRYERASQTRDHRTANCTRVEGRLYRQSGYRHADTLRQLYSEWH